MFNFQNSPLSSLLIRGGEAPAWEAVWHPSLSFAADGLGASPLGVLSSPRRGMERKGRHDSVGCGWRGGVQRKEEDTRCTFNYNAQRIVKSCSFTLAFSILKISCIHIMTACVCRGFYHVPSMVSSNAWSLLTLPSAPRGPVIPIFQVRKLRHSPAREVIAQSHTLCEGPGFESSSVASEVQACSNTESE